ncbi:MAG: Na+/H+ antiporter subunit E [Spongiibacteraceae bacterium]|jgi:multicomponent K+:H+ antiporter subunit E|nr:Na+/H+ antiporter subunit E [Spongiibacteraceae bacterium]
MRTKLLPRPLQSLALLLTWLLLANEFSLGQLLLGALFAVVLPQLVAPFQISAPRVRRLSVLAGLVVRVLGDIVVANLQVARNVLGRNSQLRPAFISLPLDIEHDVAKVMLASIVTLTPGTVSADLSRDRRHLLIHTLTTDDCDTLVRVIKQRYETPLREAFEC